MHKTLILKAFEKAEVDRINRGDKKPSLTTKAEDISSYIAEETGFSLGNKSFRNYRKEATSKKDTNTDINISQQKVVLGLLKYLGYDNYEAFRNDNPDLKTKRLNTSKPPSLITKNKIALIILSAVILGFILFQYFNTQRWMSWDGKQYIETSFDEEKLEVGILKLYNHNSVINFKKTIPNCDTKFYTESGNANLWYGKNENGDLEYFTTVGRHPKTGKTLKEITDYMIRKHICADY